MSSVLSTDDASVVNPAGDRFGVLVSAFLSAVEIMRYHEVEKFGDEIGGILAAVTGNEFLLSKIYTTQTSMVSELRPEVEMFINDRIRFMISSAIGAIEKYFDLKKDDDMGNCDMVGDYHVSRFNEMTLHEIQLVESEVLRICEREIAAKRLDDEDQHLASTKSYDLLSILSLLISQYSTISSRLLTPAFSNVRASVLSRNDDDHASVRSMIILAFMISNVVSCIMLTRGHTKMRDVTANIQPQHDLVGDQYLRSINLGSMSLSGIVCCFKNTKLLPLAVISKSGHLGTKEKMFMLNILALSKLL